MRSLFLTCASAVLVVAATACGASSPGRATDPAELTLQSSDLPSVYQRGDDSGCGGMGTENAPQRLRALVIAEHPQACVLQYERAYGTEPPLVESAALVFPDADAASDGLAIANELLPYIMGEFPRSATRVAAPAQVGDETLMLAPAGVTVEGISGRPGRAIVWRSGNVVAALLVAGIPNDLAAARATALARRQQERIEHPEPVKTTNDGQVPLDNPKLAVPVYWLGSTFAPRGLPAVDFYAGGPTGPGGGPGTVLKIDYDSKNFKAGLHLDTWTPAGWKRFRRTPLGRGIWSSPCATVHLRDRTATIYGNCTSGPVAATVDIGGVVVTVNMPYCLSCGPPQGYETRAGTGEHAVLPQLRPATGL
jgi:hypothetical protein